MAALNTKAIPRTNPSVTQHGESNVSPTSSSLGPDHSADGNNKYLPGYGRAFFLSPKSSPPLNVTGGYLGLVNQYSSVSANPFVAVEFDTFRNEWDTNSNQVSIDVDSMKSATVNMAEPAPQ
ncbi:Basic agglutinin [Acorus calamus]|uniref:Basic agglutinin n=1 Tax=Acorus calamus TaxID=4465 RepID=A0AAV9FAS5_ACOCL|nr:Basic agglutinin [Acorus calamus]